MSVTLLPPAATRGARAWPRALVAILAFGVLVRGALWLWFAPLTPQIDDELAHVRLATNLVEYGEYAFQPGHPTSLRPPLYSAFVAVVFTVAGVDNFEAVRVAQAVLSLVTVVLVFHLGRDLISERAGVWAAGMMCFYPSFLAYNNLILTEVLFTFFLVAGVSALARGLGQSAFGGLAAAGVLLGLGALTRSILYPFAPVLAVFLFATWHGPVSKRVMAVMAFAVPFAGVIAPWAVRNTLLHQTFVPVDCMGGRNFMMGNYEHTPLYRSWAAIGIEGEREWFHVLSARRPEVHGSTQGQLDKIALAEGIRFVRENPGLTAHRDLIKFFDFWGLERELVAGADRRYFGSVPRPVVVALGLGICGAYALVLFASAFGAALRPPADRRVHWLILLLTAFMCAVHTAVFAHSRYHLPVMPFLMIYAAALVTGPRPRAGWRLPAAWVAAAFCVVVVTGWVWNVALGDFDKILAALGVNA